jgi:cyanophycin synthetase
MQLVEIRDLDGPNVYLPVPALKIELATGASDLDDAELRGLIRSFEAYGSTVDEESVDQVSVAEGLLEVIRDLHRGTKQHPPETHWEEMETPGHLAIVFSWEHRRFASRVAEVVAAIATGEAPERRKVVNQLQTLLGSTAEDDDRPLLVRDSERQIPIIGITGTNGKTTTTRLVSHILRNAGRSVGWSSSTGVYINGEEVLEGDYTGPQGARRVLEEPGIDVAVLETARGGILLRGLAYESNDVSVFINVSGDHLDLQGVRTVEGLARVKATVVKATRASGLVVLNAGDPLVRGIAGGIKAPVLLFAQDDQLPAVLAHTGSGGTALVVRDSELLLIRNGGEEHVATVSDIPMTFGGRAPHMIENALAAAAACLALGLTIPEVASGLTSFRNAPDQNAGRLNVYDVNGVTVIADYAHNEAGLTQLLAFAAHFRQEGGSLLSVIGTAGDRTDQTLHALGRIAAEKSKRVIVKRTTRYLRGRPPGEMETHFQAGLREGGLDMEDPADTEIDALNRLLPDARPGDVIAMMCIEQVKEVPQHLQALGHPIS